MKIFKKWWFWVVVVIVLGAIGSLNQVEDDMNITHNDTTQQAANDNKSTLPSLNASDYKGKEGLVVYNDLKRKGYAVDADFSNQVLTDMNGKASSVFEPLDPNDTEDRQSVDAFTVGDLMQDGDSVTLIITHSVKN